MGKRYTSIPYMSRHMRLGIRLCKIEGEATSVREYELLVAQAERQYGCTVPVALLQRSREAFAEVMHNTLHARIASRISKSQRIYNVKLTSGGSV